MSAVRSPWPRVPRASHRITPVVRCRSAWLARFLDPEPTPRTGLLLCALSAALVLSTLFAVVLRWLP